MAYDSAPRGNDLEVLARQRFGRLSGAEERLVRAALKGERAMCGTNGGDTDPANDPAKADDWPREREIRADLIRWLCVDVRASKTVDPRGVWVYAATITNKLDLSHATVPFPLRLSRCRLATDTDVSYATIPELSLDGSSTESLDANGADVRGNVFLGDGFSADGEVELMGAQIGGNLECSGGRFEQGLTADRIKVGGDVILSTLKDAKGKVLGRFLAEGEVRLIGAQIGGELNCNGGCYKNPADRALYAEGARVEGAVLLGDGLRADGEVDFTGARIGVGLACDGATFTSVSLILATVKGVFLWTEIQNVRNTKLDLRSASVGELGDYEASWPGKGKLFLDGFVYERFLDGPRIPKDVRTRLRWFDRQGEFKPQPYRQLAEVLRARGDEDGAKQALFELEKRARAEGRRGIVFAPVRWFRHGEDAVFDATVGYGIYPGRAIWYLCGLTALGWIVHRRAQRVGAMAPTDKEAYTEFHEGRIPVHYQPFSPLIYSVENCLPLLKLGQDERWQPDQDPRRSEPAIAGGKLRRAVDSVLDVVVGDWALTPAALRWFRWIMIGLGWLLTTFFVAGLTGIIKVG
jgi:hypothetical protein